MATDLLLAVDGGQSQTLALIATLDGAILGEGVSGPANHIHEPGGMERINRALREAIFGAFRQAKMEPTRIRSACFGMTGGAEVVREVVEQFLQCDGLVAYEDAVTALAGASLTQPGVVVIAGTGAVALGRTADGRQAKTGGWGYIMGDEGSAYDIGIQCLHAATQAADGRGAPTALVGAVVAHFGASNLPEVRDRIYVAPINRPQIAALATVVSGAANEGDLPAQQILGQAGRNLAAAALGVMTRLDMLEAGMAVYPTGGVFRAGAWILEPFEAALTSASVHSIVKPPAFAPVIGALLIARQQTGLPINMMLVEQIRATMPALARSKSH